MLEITPASLDDEGMHGARMPMAAEDPGLFHLQKVHPIAGRTVEAERSKPNIL
jgi:hypothetical protein